MIKIMFRMFAKSFLGLIGLTIGLLMALIVLFGFVSSVNFAGGQAASCGLKSLPDLQGETRPLGKEAPLIAVIELNGTIGTSNQTFKQVRETFLEMGKGVLKNRLKGILLQINSPGGELFEVASIYSFIKEWKDRFQLPIYVYVNGLCASGGYYVACACDKIYTGDIGIVGSIGVVSSPFFNVKDGLARIGVTSLVMSAGKDKASLSPFTDWGKDEKDKRQELINFFYSKFTEIVTLNRPSVSKDRLENVLGANVFYPQQALQEGLVDVINVSRDHVIKDLIEAVNIQDDYRVIGLIRDNWLKRAFSSMAMSPLFTGRIRHDIVVNDNAESFFPYGYSYLG